MPRDKSPMTPEESFFSVFCIEMLADELNIAGDEVYRLLVDQSDILDGYVVPRYDVLHTQGTPWLTQELIALMKAKGVLR